MLAFLKKKTKSFGRHKEKQRGKSRNMCGNKGIPEVALNSGHSIPVIGFGTFAYPISGPEVVKAVLEAIKVGYRHFDSASLYGTEAPLGEAIAEALSLGLIKSRDELFITSKIWCNDAHHDLVIPALKKTLQNLNLEYLDLYLIHFPISAKPDGQVYPVAKEDIMVMDFKGVWAAMEKAQKLGLAKSIGVSNFSSKKLQELLATAKITPAINQVEVNPVWQQKKLIEFCKAKGIQVAAFSPLGSGTNRVIDNEVIVDIAKAKGKTVAQVCLRWAYEQGVVIVSKSFNEKRMKENLEIFDWELSKEENEKISKSIPQSKGHTAADFVSENGPFKSVEDIWDDVV